MMRKYMIFSIVLSVLISIYQNTSAETFDHSKFDQILMQYVDRNGLVDYNRIAKDSRFKEYVESLASAKVDELSRNGQLAFWINAYNAVTIDKVIQWKPKKSVRETLVPGVWTSTKFFTTRDHNIAGRRLSQDDIEHQILRKELKEFRIHFAIVCASSSCPLLARFAFTAENVQAKLEEETRKYINSSRGTRIDAAENILYLSKIFDWFSGDFKYKSGSVLEFIRPYLGNEAVKFLERDPKISYIHYDWALNAKEPLQ
ncbi:MAG: DUF547 domain-containing protein [Desulfobacterales bacterium]|nr:MAG: DUF547 domain-containing protein [Desulfobacterales bacterium]